MEERPPNSTSHAPPPPRNHIFKEPWDERYVINALAIRLDEILGETVYWVTKRGSAVWRVFEEARAASTAR